MKKFFVGALLLVAVVLVVIAQFEMKKPNTLRSAPIPSVEQKTQVHSTDGTYLIEGEKVTLKNGKSEVVLEPGTASTQITSYFGNEVRGDFNGDGILDTAFLLTQDSGGSGTLFYVAALLSSGNTFAGSNAVLIGDRISPQSTVFQDGEIIVNYTDRKPDDAMTTEPSVGVSKRLNVQNGKLVEVSS